MLWNKEFCMQYMLSPRLLQQLLMFVCINYSEQFSEKRRLDYVCPFPLEAMCRQNNWDREAT